MKTDDYFMKQAILEARKSFNNGGIPIGAVLVKDDEVISRGHNRLIQNDSVILHGEMDAIENAGRLDFEDYVKCTLYTTLSPCPMCSGAVVLYNIPKVVIGENITLKGCEDYLKLNNVEVVVLNNEECRQMFEEYIRRYPDSWRCELAKVGNSTELKQ